jgi:hypothetical protein
MMLSADSGRSMALLIRVDVHHSRGIDDDYGAGADASSIAIGAGALHERL